jgi:hypothetical protein
MLESPPLDRALFGQNQWKLSEVAEEACVYRGRSFFSTWGGTRKALLQRIFNTSLVAPDRNQERRVGAKPLILRCGFVAVDSSHRVASSFPNSQEVFSVYGSIAHFPPSSLHQLWSE